jgi:hypothetical protein
MEGDLGDPGTPAEQVADQGEGQQPKRSLPPGFAEHMFKPGQSGNPTGRPKGIPSLTAILRRESLKRVSQNEKFRKIAENLGIDNVEELTVGELIVVVTIAHAMLGQAPLLNSIWNRLDGKVPDRIAGHDGGPLEINQDVISRIMSSPDAMKHARALARAARDASKPGEAAGEEEPTVEEAGDAGGDGQ